MRKKFTYLTLFAGAEPYPRISPYKLPSVLQKGYRIPKPEYFKDELYVYQLFIQPCDKSLMVENRKEEVY